MQQFALPPLKELIADRARKVKHLKIQAAMAFLGLLLLSYILWEHLHYSVPFNWYDWFLWFAEGCGVCGWLADYAHLRAIDHNISLHEG